MSGNGSTPYNNGQDKSVLLDVQNVSVDYLTGRGPVHAVNDVSFKLHRGEVFGLAGESGSGKSTLAYAIARLHRPPAVITGGSVIYTPHRSNHVFQGQIPNKENGAAPTAVDVLSLNPQQLRAFRWHELSIVFQSAMNALNPVMRLENQILDVLQTHNPEKSRAQHRERAVELMRLVGIAPDRLRSYPHELSGGMRQRAIIAIALALNPELIIMDEPTTALDVVVQRDILRELLDLRSRFNFAIIFITHDLSLLLEISDQIGIMYAGRIVEQAPSNKIYTDPHHPYTVGLLNSFPTLRGERRKMHGIPGSPPDLRTPPPGCPFNPRCPERFETCTRALPLLAAHRDKSRLVACHLYDPTQQKTIEHKVSRP